MFKTLLQDRDIIERKYHNPDAEFNSFNRMGYHGYDYDEATGLNDAEIDKGLAALSDELQSESHPVCKARLFEYVLDNTRIDVSEHDYFTGMYTWARPLSKYTVNKWSNEVHALFPEEAKLLSDYEKAGISYGFLDFDHTIPDWDILMEVGFKGISERISKQYEFLKQAGQITKKQEEFFKGVQIEYNAVIRFIDRLYNYALTKHFDKAPKIAQCLLHLREGAPTDTYEALMLIYLYFMISESIEHYQVRSLGHGLDAQLYPFFEKDIKENKYTKDEIAELIGYFLMQWSAIGNYWGQPFYLGGMNADGTTKVNELSYMILDVYDKLGLYNPKIQIKVNGSTPHDFTDKALEMIRHGTTSIVFCNNDVITKCLMARGATYEEAVDSVVSGCYEYKVKGKGIGISSTYFSLLKPVSLVFDNGFDTITQKQVSIKTGEIETFTTFDDFYKAYLAQLKHTLKGYVDARNILETKISEINPSLLFSATQTDCVTSMTDAIDGGIENTTDILISGLGSTVDSLMEIYEIVFEKKIVSLPELKAALANDWNGYEKLRAQALKTKHRYGNGDFMADSYAAAITCFVHDIYAGQVNSHGGKYLLEMHSARAFIIHGESTCATPDGRKHGDETSKNASPAPGSDRNGITALIKSATQIDSSLCTNGFCLDAMLHPSAVQGEDGLAALRAVLETYLAKGGASIHFNIFDTAMLRDAQSHPEKYKNLQVRVCGWNVLWNNMDKKEQDAYILRAENIQ